ncbi:MAG: glutamine--fructose-6-phosphate transaminase (isomerizing) [Euryarchaeota archaeon]|jgi:glucosamine--fructose-6-phosphate aminotransferase (isomerizing)|nr:glutamine--fructose-6-phosphate transaminase (isomerizing) [Euryarchaeota archaeon]MBT5594105.1 glutamine--fructose-6-phosphate transaminase (isomerizing) [Euryarchaeota archaeon]MBT5844743.1 glutamine--fructose-6-phosphate transaminase (isomerizing) [Euryarchaeota archaeon]MBT6844575.1 glutamine--fructose-6-phosphate transaminase (isomerizing) [Euryarchaeota archaeon]MBT7064187.1 glutamine--fructose-6-phosphate transaminase (isomerizing) [Euryarchaeota archaeon]
MCGIFGYLGPRQASDILLDGLRRLEYRGYDSTGIAVKDEGIQIFKKVGKVADLESILPSQIPGTHGIAHTRWATHGIVSDSNAHPHLSSNGKVVIVHNGIIENTRQLRTSLTVQGVELQSDTDSEALAHVIERELNIDNNPENAVRRTLHLARGTWGLCALFLEHDMIVCARNGSPLIIGQGDGEMFVSSDPHALTPYTQRVVFLEDGEIATLTSKGMSLSTLKGKNFNPSITVLEDDWGESELGEFPHFMLKEIYEQPDALRHCISGRLDRVRGNGRLGGLKLEPRDLAKVPHVRLLGCGTAYNAAEIGQMLIEKLARIPAVAHISSEFRHNDPVINPNALHFAVTQSGETADTLSAVKEIQLKGGSVYGVVNVVGSSIARECGKGVYIHSGPEQAVASTKAFSNMVAALSMFALQVGRSRATSKEQGKELIHGLQQIPHLIEEYLENQGPILEAVEMIKDAKCVLFLGRGISAPVAKEGALKLMEIAYIPCLAYPAGEMKHGPIALLEEGSPVIFIAPNDHVKVKTISAIHECRARGARIILIHEEGDEIAEEADICIPIPRVHPLLSPLLTVIPTQLIAYHAALALDCNVDRPRNLAKSVTVE